MLSKVQNLFLLGMLVDIHLGLVHADFEVTAAISEGILSKKGQKRSFHYILTLYTHPEKGYRLNSNSRMGYFD